MAIAETGTIVLVTNEGNADLTTTLPPVHIALFGIDKIVASLDDAVAVLRMLPRSGTGQIINLISIAGKTVFPNASAYCASKWGALGFTRVLASEVRHGPGAKRRLAVRRRLERDARLRD